MTRSTAPRLPALARRTIPRPVRSPRMRSVHPQQLTLALWAPDELAARRHLRLLPAPAREPEPVAPLVAIAGRPGGLIGTRQEAAA